MGTDNDLIFFQNNSKFGGKLDVESLDSYFLPEYKEASERPLEENDFMQHRKEVEVNLKKLLIDMDSVEESYDITSSELNTSSTRTKFITYVIVLCGQNSETSLWTTNISEQHSHNILLKLVDYCGHKSIEELLYFSHEFFFRQVLLKIRPWLLRETWKHYPGAVTCYKWILSKMKMPHLGEHLNLVLPTALIIMDDHEVDYIIIGVKCLEHIIKNVAKTELSWFDRDKVIFKALEPNLYKKEATVICPLFSTLISLLDKMISQVLVSTFEWTEYDEVMGILLNNMSLEQRLAIREAYMKVFPAYINSMGLGVIRHLPRINDVLEEYLLEPTTSFSAIEALNVLLSVAWPRMDRYCETIFLTLLKLLLDATNKGSYHQKGTVPAAADSLRTLSTMFPETAKKFTGEIDCFDFNNEFKNILREIFLVVNNP